MLQYYKSQISQSSSLMPQTSKMYISHHRYTYKSKELMENSIPRSLPFLCYNVQFTVSECLVLAVSYKNEGCV